MIPPFVDADVIVRLITGDDLVKQAAARTFFDRVEAGEIVVDTPVTTIADVACVLASPKIYGLPRAEVGAALGTLVRLPSFRVANRRAVLRALDLFGATRLDFGDAFIIASMEQADAAVVVSYDRDFDRVSGITREEP